MSDGGHTISVYAVDPAGNRGPTMTETFTVVTAAPVLTSTPSGIALGVATYKWFGTARLTYQCSYDAVPQVDPPYDRVVMLPASRVIASPLSPTEAVHR